MKIVHKSYFAGLFFTISLCACKKDPSVCTGPIGTGEESSFEKTYGSEANKTGTSILLSANRLIITGTTNESKNTDVLLYALNLDGNKLWGKTYGGSSDDAATKIIETADGNFIIAGSTTTYGAGMKDGYLLKVSCNGKLLWENTFGGPDDDYIKDVIELKGGDLLLTGITYSYGAGSRDIYLIRTGPDGNIRWQKTFGGKDLDGGNGLVAADDSTFHIFGYTQNLGAGSRDFYLLKINETGDSLWARTYGGMGYEESHSFQKTADNGYILAGHSSSADPIHDMYMVKIDHNGSVEWERHFGGDRHDGGVTVMQDSEGNYLLAGETDSYGEGATDIYLVKTDPNGSVIYEKTFGGKQTDYPHAILESDSSCFIVGKSNSTASKDFGVYLIKFSGE